MADARFKDIKIIVIGEASSHDPVPESKTSWEKAVNRSYSLSMEYTENREEDSCLCTCYGYPNRKGLNWWN